MMNVEFDDDDAPFDYMDETLVYLSGYGNLLVDYFSKQTTNDTRWPALVSALSVIAASGKNNFVARVFPDKVTPLNLYCVLVAQTGDGKDLVQDTALAISKITGFGVANNISSSAALHSGLLKHGGNGLLLVKDEFGKLLKFARANEGSHLNDFMNMMLEAYSRSNSALAERHYAKKRDDLELVDRPFFNVVAMSTPETLQDGMRAGDITDGTLNRLIMFAGLPATKKDIVFPFGSPVRGEKETDVLPELPRRALQLIAAGMKQDVAGDVEKLKENLKPKTLFIADELTAKRLERLRDECLRQVQDTRKERYGVLYARKLENVIRVAGNLALFDAACTAVKENRAMVDDDLRIETAHVVYATRLVDNSIGWTIHKIAKAIKATDRDRLRDTIKEKVLDIAEKVKRGGWAPKRNVMQSLKGGGRSYRALKEEIESLIESGEIEVQKFKGARRPIECWRLTSVSDSDIVEIN